MSNTPLQYVLESSRGEDLCIFQIDLFNARGVVPATLLDVAQREKDIRFSTRTRLTTDRYRELHAIRAMAKRLYEKLPAGLRDDPDARRLGDHGDDSAVTIVHLIHRKDDYDTATKDYEFSRRSVEDHWQAGFNDAERTLNHDAWRQRERPADGLAVFALARAY